MTDMFLVHVQATPGRTIFASTGAVLRQAISAWHNRRAGHQALLLSDRMLHDIGLTRCMLVHQDLTIEAV